MIEYLARRARASARGIVAAAAQVMLANLLLLAPTSAWATGPIPIVSSVSPNSGPASGGQLVTITGANMSAAAGVSFGGTPGTIVSIPSGNSVLVHAPSGTGTVDVRVTNANGTSLINANDTFTYIAAPTVTSISPATGAGAGGTTVTITGTGLSGATAVTFGATAATGFTVSSATSMTALAPAGAGTVDVRVTGAGGTSATTAADQYTYIAAPTVTSISPTAGPNTGGTTVTIMGTGLSDATAVSFGARPATTFTVNSATSITATAPVGSGTVDIRVTGAGGLSAASGGDKFTYLLPPQVAGTVPTAGPSAGGTTVVLHGNNLSTTTGVTFGGTPVTSFTVNSNAQITVTAPAGSPGLADVLVTTAGGTSATGETGGAQFLYFAPPTITSVSPAAGPAAGGTTVTITGTNVGLIATAVSFGATPATAFTVNSQTSITATAPAGTGTVDIRVTAAGGTSATSAADQYSYAAAPTVTSISPAAGPSAGGTMVTITGTDLAGATAVTFGGTAATAFTVNSATSITATAPAGSAGAIDVTVTTSGGTSATGAADRFTYVAAPRVISVSPIAGPTAGGMTVTITGTGFTGATAVTFGATAATGFTVTSATSITATTPAGTGTVDVRVTTTGGTSPTNGGGDDRFIYVTAPTVSSISPSAGAATGGNGVTITGTGLSNATAVTFGATAAIRFTVNSDTSISATAPAGSGTVDVVVTTLGGPSATSAGDQFTYVLKPMVTSISPTAGPVEGGATVTITGTDLSGATEVTFGAKAAAGFTVNSATSITATAPTGVGTVDLRVTTAGGTSATSAGDQFTYVPTPIVSLISPATGPAAGGTTVTIFGLNLSGATAVTFGAMAATGFTVNSASSITATAPAGSGMVDIHVTTTGGTSATSTDDRFTYVATPTVSSISPTAGPNAGGTTVTITGTGFSGATAVTFGATAATGFTVNSATSITATAPAGSGGVDLQVTTVGGTSATSAADRYTYVDAPTVTSLSPASGPAAGGTTVTITGGNLAGTTAVMFGATPASGFTVIGATGMTATAPAGAGIVDVRVTTAGGTSATSAGDQYTYNPPPTVTSISPGSGPSAGGARVTITGTNLSGATAVTFGGVTAPSYDARSATSIITTVPAGTGTVDVRVTTPDGTSATSGGDQYTYVAAPTVTSISPASGPAAGGTMVTITGTGLSGTTAVTFDGIDATGFTVNSATLITATAPAGTGIVDVRVTTIGGTSAASGGDQFSYLVAPTVTALSPNAGPSSGGTTVTITGTDLAGTTAVSFGGTAATGFTINSATSITATAPAGTGTVDIHVTTTGGTSTTSAADQYTYVAAPTVTSISPASGPAAGGTTVTITGTGLSGATAVSFGATAATGFTINSATSITATAPAGSGTIDLRVTTTGGTSATSGGDQFSYVAAPTVTTISPNSGPSAGGTIVTITGSNLEGATAVTFGATAATGFIINNATSITATAPAGTGTVDIRVTTTGGTSATSAGDRFGYAAITLTPATLPGIPAGAPYNQPLTADGGTAPYSYAVTSGALPPGLALSADGTLSGTPGQPGSYDFTVTATDASAAPGPFSGSQDYTMVVAAPAGPMTNTWVSGDGDDANICSRDYPCRTFAAALALTAAGGEIDCLTPGGYGTLTITQSVSIVCRRGTAGVVGSGTDGIVINGPAGTAVTLSGLDLEGLGDSEAPAGINGIRFLGGSSLTLHDIRIHGFSGGYGIAFQPSSAAILSIDRTTVTGNGSGAVAASGGVLVQPGADALVRVAIANSRVEDNLQLGIVFRLKGTSNARVAATLDRLAITGNASTGVLSNAPTGTGSIDLSLTGSTLLDNDTGILANGASVARVTRTTISGNATGVAASGGATITSFGDNRLAGNVADGSFTATSPQR